MSTALYDDADFVERLIKYLIRSKAVFQKAKVLGMTGDDLIISEEFGFRLYKTMADLAFKINAPPVDRDVFMGELKTMYKEGGIHDSQLEYACKLASFFYDGSEIVPAQEEYVVNNLKSFIEHRRFQRIKTENSDDLVTMRDSLNQLTITLKKADSSVVEKEVIINPFDKMVTNDIYPSMMTGFNKIDQVMGGLHYGGYYLLLGYTGGGKTALGVNFCSNAALQGLNAVYVSMEELAEHVIQRFYARFFKLPYTPLYHGKANFELGEAWQNQQGQEHFELMKKHLRVIGLKEVAPVTTDVIYSYLEDLEKRHKFIPDLVVVDQLEFIDPCDGGNKNIQSWEKNQIISNQCDALSHRRIGGRFFALVVQHQIKGNMKWRFQPSDIDGYKGILKPVDTAFGVGRENKASERLNIFSLKSRHHRDFEYEYFGDFEHMDIIDKENKGFAEGQFANPPPAGTTTNGTTTTAPDSQPPPSSNPIVQ